jgi:polar amino acid transport system substrate-binding protein
MSGVPHVSWVADPPRLSIWIAGFMPALVALLLSLVPAQAQTRPSDSPFFDLTRKPERVDLIGQRVIRFLTEDDYPPFNFLGVDGQLTGFNVDLARAICVELKAACTIQARRWDTLVGALEEGRGDAIISSLSSQNPARGRLEFGLPYYRTPARFAARKDQPIRDVTASALRGMSVAVVRESAHAAFLTAFYPQVEQKPFPDQDEALKALAAGQADLAFGDGIGMAVWLNGQGGAACCNFLGGPFYESRFFGEGASIAFRKDAVQLRRAVDYALFRLAEQGLYRDLLLKYFPVAFY